ncbi:MAG: peptidoglycan-binding protein [Acetobacteraceae bacterium]
MAGLTILGFGGSLLLAPPPATAAPAREALVIGNGTYGSLPPLPACLQSAHAVAAALRGLGFQVVEREDLSTGGTDAAIGEYSRQLAAGPGAAAVVYSCGYATSFNDRPFVLPVSARISRPADVLTQGILAKLLVDVVTRGGAGAAIVAIDTVPIPDTPAAPGFDVLAQASLPDGLGLIAVSQAKPPDGPTPLATALIAGLKGTDVQTTALLSGVQQQLASRPVTVAALRPPAVPAYLAGGAPATTPGAPSVAQTPATTPPIAPAAASQGTSQAASQGPMLGASPGASIGAPPFLLPAEEQMSEADRRAVQAALVRLGYYPGPVDGRFGGDTRAAIRRYQHELGGEMTGRLTAAQASRLVGAR